MDEENEERFGKGVNNMDNPQKLQEEFRKSLDELEERPRPRLQDRGYQIALVDVDPDTTSLDVPSEVSVIGYYAFGNCLNLESVSIPEGVQAIYPNAFKSPKLKSVTLPESMAIVNMGAFDTCTNLQTVTILGMETYLTFRAFPESQSVEFRVRRGSEAEKYLAKYGRKIQIIDEM